MDFSLLFLIPLSFICEFIDSSFGMGYGTILTPLLLLCGFEPLQIVPAILVSEFATGAFAAFSHHRCKNVTFHKKSIDTKVAFALSIFAIIGTFIAVPLTIYLPVKTIKLIISIIVISMSIVILATFKIKPHFTWLKLTIFGIAAAFNKGISGGGYGPLVMGGQILSGVGVKNAIAITSFSESIACFVGVILYIIFDKVIAWNLAFFLVIGGLLSVPFAVLTVKKIYEKNIKILTAFVIFILGLVSLLKEIM
ncbi:hypothetical protein A2335_04120 [Candidatus Peregrinibacteria bacterium RIFOXYB2_FULL_32_7]|nr:MAG: hypothetical protein A2335_04120 [Candidatus Peregrinibacteria bacterium RIFOXYB2_FULL_32_7]